MCTGVLFGLVPALQVSKVNLSVRTNRHRLRNALVVSEVALALMLLVASGLLIRSFIRVLDVNPGFRTDHLILVSTGVPTVRYAQPQQRLDLYYSLEEKLRNIPGVTSVGAVSRFPLSGATGSNNVTSYFTIEGQTVATGERPEIDYRIASTDYFETMGIPLLRGRKFTRQDSTQVAIINEAAAKKFWPNQDPIGKRINFGDPAQVPWVSIVGIVGDIRHLGLQFEPRAEVYRPYANNPLTGPAIAVHTATDPATLPSLIRAEVHSVESEMPVTINSIDELIALSVAERRFSMLVLGVFAGLAMLLAVVGIYGVMSYAVSQRTQEIGVRIALGAGTPQLLAMIIREGLLLTGIGVFIGAAGASVVTRAMAKFVFQISTMDFVTYLSVSSALLAVTLLACFVPAYRATRVDPLIALRHE
jgi:putative ABC transport system permease protein